MAIQDGIRPHTAHHHTDQLYRQTPLYLAQNSRTDNIFYMARPLLSKTFAEVQPDQSLTVMAA